MKWFDLSRFGAKLSVLPKSGARSRTVLRLEMPHSHDWDARRAELASIDPPAAAGFTREAFHRKIAELGFGALVSRRLSSPTKEVFDQHGDEYVAYVGEAVRDSIKLSELQELMPGLSAADVVDVPITSVIVRQDDLQGYEAQWESLRRAMVNDATQTWVPNNDAWRQKEKPEPLLDALEGAGLGLRQEGRDRSIPAALALHADALGYREDALMTYYVSEEAALADGLKEGEFHRAGSAASVPVLVAGEGKVVALRDVWDMPDLRRTISPREALRIEPEAVQALGSVVVQGIKERQSYRALLSSSLTQLDEWIAHPELVAGQSSDMIWGKVSVVAQGRELADKYPHLSPDGASDYMAVLEASGNGWRLRRLGAIHNDEFGALARAIGRDGVVTEAQALDTLLGARLLWQKMHKAELAAQAERELAASVPPATEIESTADATDKRKHVDVGEKIGGARKDYYKRALDADDVGAMNEIELALHVNKQNIWPPLDYAAMRERGMEAVVAMSLKLVKDALNTKPASASWRISARDSAAEYVEAIEAMRQCFEDVATKDDFLAACTKAKDYAGDGDSSVIYGGRKWQQLGKDLSKLLSYDRDSGASALRQAQSKIERATRSFDRDSGSLVYDDPWKALIKTAKTANDDELTARKKKAEIDRELHVPHLAHVKRHGEDWRQGRDVTADELLEHFGFRGIEYGEWLPQGERQEVINMAFDSFADLAQALQLRPKDVSLGGELAVAFGARGTGGRGAALAHFEPGRFVMNMTRMRGAGVVAHEWFHALDRKQAMNMGAALYGSESDAYRGKALGVLVERMSKRRATVDELLEQSDKGAARCKSNAESWLGRLSTDRRPQALSDLATSLGNARQALVERVRESLDLAAVTKKFGMGFGVAGLIGSHVLSDLAETVRSEMVSNWRGQLGKDAPKAIFGNVYHWAKHEGLGETIRQMQDRKMEIPLALFECSDLKRDTRYLKDAKELDKLRSSSYWATTREMFARAGAAFVQDKIADLGGRSDYLVYGSEDGRVVAGMAVSPNPRGDDRQALAACFEAMLDEYRMTLTSERENETSLAAEVSP